MRAGGAKAKGGAFERSVCQGLSRWLSNGTRDDLFWRSAMSGGRATVAAKNNKHLRAQCGDICAVDPLGNTLTDICYFELKALKRLSLDDLVKGNTGSGSFLAIWKTTREQAARYDKTPVLVMKQNFWPVLVCSTDIGIGFLCGNVTPLLTAPGYELRCVLYEDMLVRAPPNRRRI